MMRNRRFLLALALLALFAASSLGLRQGRRAGFVADTYPNLVLHRPSSLAKGRTEALASALQEAYGRHAGYHQVDGSGRLEAWVLPETAPLPEGLPKPPVDDAMVAVAPLTIIAREPALRRGKAEMDVGGAVALAVTQPQASPAFSVPWLYRGMAEVLRTDPRDLPTPFYKGSAGQPLDAADLLNRLEAPSPGDPAKYRQAAAALAAFLIDRWGIDWPRHGRIDAARLTPVGALTWTAGAPDRSAALARWQGRMRDAQQRDPKRPWLITLAEMSPVRVQPALSALPTGPGPRPNVSPHRYAISGRYTPENRAVTGQERLHWQNGEGIAVDALYFNLWANAEQFAIYGGNIAIHQVTVDGRPVPWQAHGLDLVVSLGRSVEPGEAIDLSVDFTTRLPATVPFRMFGQGDTGRFHLVHWYPQLAVLDDRGWNLQPFPTYPGEPYHETADYAVTLDLPAGTQLGATGHLVSRTVEGDRWLYTYDAPRVRDWAATGGRNLTEQVVQAGDVRIHVLDDDPAFVEPVAREAARALALFNERFGPYPYSDLVVSCCAGVEYPALFFTRPVAKESDSWRVTLYHELAHQWFYGLVGNDQFTEPWLDEGFARYADRVASRELGAPVSPSAPPYATLPAGLHVSSSSREYALHPQTYGLGVYTMGADALEALAKQIGEAAFRQLLREWVARYRYQVATTADFIRLAEAMSGQSLERFFTEHRIRAADRLPYRPLVPWP